MLEVKCDIQMCNCISQALPEYVDSAKTFLPSNNAKKVSLTTLAFDFLIGDVERF